jgi:hypothetical protein
MLYLIGMNIHIQLKNIQLILLLLEHGFQLAELIQIAELKEKVIYILENLVMDIM